MSQWVRLWEDMPTDPKWRVIARKSGQSIGNVMAVFNFMLVCAANATERGELVGWDDEDVGAALDVEGEQIAAIREAMQGKVLDGVKLKGWEKRQPQREDGAAERAKAWRERKKEPANATERTQTQPNATEPPEEKRRDPDTEKKEDKLFHNLLSPPPLAIADDAPEDDPSEEEGETLTARRAKPEDTELILDLVDIWNVGAASIGLPQVQDITEKRKAAIRARVKDFPTYGHEDPRDGFNALMANIRGSPFLTGVTSAGFRANFDFATKSSSFHKIMEGSYEAAAKGDRRKYG